MTRLLIAISVFQALAGCAPLQPVAHTADRSGGAVLAPVWEPLAARPARDESVLLNEGMDALDVRLRAIDSATASIDLQTFLWTFDRSGSAIARHLLAAAERGVRVRILVDDTFLAGRDASVLAFADHDGIEYRIFNPHKQRGPEIALTTAVNLVEMRRLDHRMHNKAMIVDGQIAIAGGRNLADEYFGINDEGNFRDVELLLRGPILGDLAAAFDAYWNSPWSQPLADIANPAIGRGDLAPGATLPHAELSSADLAQAWASLFERGAAGPATLVVDRAPQDNPARASEAPVQVADFLVDLFDSAREEIVILSAYLIPTPSLEGAVARAVERGVRVRMLTNSLRSNNHLSAHSAYRNHIRTLLEGGTELYEVRADALARPLYMVPPTESKELALHAKALLVDNDRVFVGSANLDPRSLRINTELGLLVVSPTLNAQMREAFAPDFSPDNAWNLGLTENGKLVWRAHEVTLDAPPADSFMQRIEDWFLSTLPIESEL